MSLFEDSTFCASACARVRAGGKLTHRAKLALVLLAVASACGEKSDSENGAPASQNYASVEFASAAIGPSGGEVGDVSRATVSVPEGALASSVEIRVSELTRIEPGSALELPSGATAVSPIFLLEPLGQSFAKPVTVTIGLAGGVAANAMLLASDGSAAWGAISGSAALDDVVQGEVSVLSFVVAVDRATVGTGSISGAGGSPTSAGGSTSTSGGATSGGSAGLGSGGTDVSAAGAPSGGSGGSLPDGVSGGSGGTGGTQSGGTGGSGGTNSAFCPDTQPAQSSPCPDVLPTSGVACNYEGVPCSCYPGSTWQCGFAL